MALHCERLGPEGRQGEPPRLVLAHGFTQNTACWGRFASSLAQRFEVVLVDAPGHGQSGHDEADLQQAALLTTEVGGAGVYVGYSMGGRMALHAALARPDLVTGLVLIGATAGIDSAEERADRRAADDQLAERLLRDGLDGFLERWLALPLFAGLSEEQSARPQRLANRSEGLAASLRSCGTGSQQPLWDRLSELTMPVAVIAGSQDQKFTALGSRLVDAMTGTSAELISVPGTHAVHLEQPTRTAEAVGRAIAGWVR